MKSEEVIDDQVSQVLLPESWCDVSSATGSSCFDTSSSFSSSNNADVATKKREPHTSWAPIRHTAPFSVTA